MTNAHAAWAHLVGAGVAIQDIAADESIPAFLRDKLTCFLRSQQFHGKVTDEDLALALLARSQSSNAAGAVSQSTLQIEQLLSLVSMA